MKLKYILIIVGSMLLLLGLLTFATPGSSSRGSYRSSDSDKSVEIIISLIGIGTLLTGIFWKKQ